MIANSERTAFSYDAYGYVTTENDIKNKIINTYTNDVNGNRKRLEVKDNGTVVMTADYTYDILDRLTNVSFDGGSASVSYTYDANGNMLTETKNGDVTEYAYNAAGLLKTQTGGDSPDYTMTYSLDGNKVGETDSVNGYRSYVYNGIGQLKNETLSNNGIVNSSISYTYDTRGNRTSSNKNGTICNYTYDRNNRLINDDNGIRTNSYAYDKNGNMVCRMSGTYIDSDKAVGEVTSMNVFGASASQASDISNSTAVYYTYNAVNKLKVVQSDDGMVATYGYDAKGRRISKTVNGITTTQSWDGDYIIREKDSEGTESARYYRARNLVANNSSDAVNYYSYDPHGSVVSIGGKTYTYDAFGNQTNDIANDTNPFRYNGEYFDNETGYIYLRARYYDPSIGRFTTEDPVKDGLNWYVYCSNNPVMFVDPSGMTGEAEQYVSKWCQNYDDIEKGSQTYTNISSAARAYRSGLISYENLAFNIVENGGQLREDKKLSPVTVSVSGYIINIMVHIKYSGNLAFKNFGSTGYTYSEIASLGVEQYWSGDIGYYRINTSVSESNLSVYKAIDVNILDGMSTNSNVDLVFKGRPVNIYFSDYEKVLNWSDIESKSVEKMKILGAHEIGGHSAFGLLDNYGKNAVKGFESIMNGGFSATSPPYAIDLAYMLYNYKNSGFRKMMHYSENSLLLDKYAPGWTR